MSDSLLDILASLPSIRSRKHAQTIIDEATARGVRWITPNQDLAQESARARPQRSPGLDPFVILPIDDAGEPLNLNP